MSSKIRRDNLFTLGAPKGGDMLILYTDKSYTKEQMTAVDNLLRDKHGDWHGVFLVFGIDQKLEKMPEPMARELYAKLKAVFEPEAPT